MHKNILAVASLAIVLGATLAGCAPTKTVYVHDAAPKSHTAPDTTSDGDTDSDPTIDSNLLDTAFLATVRHKYSNMLDVPDATVIKVATSACKAFDAGATWSMIYAEIAKSEMPGEMAYITGAGIATYCPEYNDEIR